MINLLISLIGIISVIAFIIYFAYIGDNSISHLYLVVGLILVILVFWGAIREFSRTQNYKIDKDIVMTDRIQMPSASLSFSKKLKVEIIEFDMPMVEFKDYKNYRIYFDSLTYIDIKNNKFDSLDLKYGKKLYRE